MEADLDKCNRSDLIIDTYSHCFLCVRKGSVETESENLLKLSSFQHLSRYLKMDLKKVFREGMPIPSSLLDRVSRCKMKVWLCSDCQFLSDRFPKLWAELEKIHMEMTECLKNIHEKIRHSSETNLGMLDEIGDLELGNLALRKEKLSIVQTVRGEVMNKCALHLKNIQPRVKLRRLSTATLARYNSQNQPMLKREDEVVEDPGDGLSVSDPLETGDDNFSDFDVDVPSANVLTQIKCDPFYTESVVAAENKNASESSDLSEVISTGMCMYFDTKNAKKNGCKYGCHQCGKTYAFKALASYHYKMVHLKYKFRCNLCPFQAFPNNEQLQEHLSTCGGSVRGRKYKKIKGTNFFPPSSHVKALQSLEGRTCPLCHKTFCQKQKLIRHYSTIHLGERNFACDICSYKFSQKNNLLEHRARIHFGYKIACTMNCGQEFSSRKALKDHQLECPNLKLRKK